MKKKDKRYSRRYFRYKYTDNTLVVEFEKLRKNVNNSVKFFLLSLTETEEEIEHKKLQLKEILRDINSVNKRIQNNIFVIKRFF